MLMLRVTSPKDLWSGAIYIALGAAALWFGAEYRMGTAGRMGPGYFPKVLAWLLIGIGAIAVVRGFILKGNAVKAIAWKPLLIVLASCALFGLLLPRLGLGAALLALCLGSATASREFRFDPIATVGLLALVCFCALVFVKGLGVPMPLLGSWLEPTLGPLLPWLR
jgi:hypothetical protein